MWSRGGRSSALDRAEALLSGKRTGRSAAPSAEQSGREGPAAKTPGHSGAIGGPVKNRSAPANTHTLFLDLSDLSPVNSVSDHGEGTVVRAAERSRGGERDLSKDPRPETSLGGGGLRFLKKVPPPTASSQSPTISRSQVQQSTEPSYVSSSWRGSQSAALNRLALIEDRIRRRKESQIDTQAQSQAEEGAKPAQKIASGPGLSPQPPGPRSLEGPLLLSAQSSSDLSPKGKSFIKKTGAGAADSRSSVTAAVTAKGSDVSVKTRTADTAILFDRSRAASLSDVKTKTRSAVSGVNLDSDEEDMRKLLGESLDSTEDGLLRQGRTSSMTAAGKLLNKSIEKMSPTPPTQVRPPSSSRRASSRSSISSLQRRSPFRFSGQAHVQFSPSALSLSPPPSGGPSSPPRTESPPRSLSSMSGRSVVLSLEELFPVAPASEDSHSLVCSEDFKLNIMSLDDLAPVTFGLTGETTEEVETRPSKHKTPASGSLPADQQLPREKEKKKKTEEEEEQEQEEVLDYQSDFESESRTEPDYSASQVSEHLGGDREEEEDISQVREEESWSDLSRGRTEDEYSSSFSDASRSYTTRTSDRSQTSQSLSRRTHSRSSALDGDWSSSHRSRKSRSPHRALREAAVQTRPDLLAYSWSAGMATLGPAVGATYSDPTPVASHTVSAETVEALSTYSPAVFALNDMLRQQLALTRQFIESSRRLHSHMVQSLGPADYSYTTLEDTKEFIRKHKPRQLTVEEALEEVLQEMRDYHYI
ncbi:uncharacterized protein C19orf44 homolog isoform X2 [Myripristis murdjan]|uniref:DUF4614 domain-containing protein n=1 Tax=Myripristis murdjan TaxID=586833 RepID=A0A667ZUS4_9TELE|nr:uncharacterized protein C19orf44 homolog isoform X2 [Myripristis murdjan]